MKVLIAIDAFKGSLSSKKLAEGISVGIKKVFTNADIIVLPIADGGEGTVESLVEGTDGEIIYTTVKDPLMNDIQSYYGIMGDKKTAVIEMALASGLPLVPKHKQNPLYTTTYGTGQLIKDAISSGCREFIIGIGGSATNDGGLGAMQALGIQFLDKDQNILGQGGQILSQLAYIDKSNMIPEIQECSFVVACDVDNPFYGERGAAYIYGPQKGATPEIVQQLDKGLKHLGLLIKDQLGIDICSLAGAGAAGGLGGGLVAFLGARLQSGVTSILEKIEFEKHLKDVDFIITGEGRIDAQTLMGKAPIGVSILAKKHNIPVIALSGNIADDADKTHEKGIGVLFSIINYPILLDEAMDSSVALKFITKNSEEIFRLIKICKDKFQKEQ